MKLILLTLVLSIVVSFHSIVASEVSTDCSYWISSNGNDLTGNGTNSSPFKSLDRAFLKAKEDNYVKVLTICVDSTSEYKDMKVSKFNLTQTNGYDMPIQIIGKDIKNPNTIITKYPTFSNSDNTGKISFIVNGNLSSTSFANDESKITFYCKYITFNADVLIAATTSNEKQNKWSVKFENCDILDFTVTSFNNELNTYNIIVNNVHIIDGATNINFNTIGVVTIDNLSLSNKNNNNTNVFAMGSSINLLNSKLSSSKSVEFNIYAEYSSTSMDHSYFSSIINSTIYTSILRIKTIDNKGLLEKFEVQIINSNIFVHDTLHVDGSHITVNETTIKCLTDTTNVMFNAFYSISKTKDYSNLLVYVSLFQQPSSVTFDYAHRCTIMSSDFSADDDDDTRVVSSLANVEYNGGKLAPPTESKLTMIDCNFGDSFLSTAPVKIAVAATNEIDFRVSYNNIYSNTIVPNNDQSYSTIASAILFSVQPLTNITKAVVNIGKNAAFVDNKVHFMLSNKTYYLPPFSIDNKYANIITINDNLNNTHYECPPGSYSSTLISNCKVCNAGSFSNLLHDTSCVLCKPGEYQPNVAQSTCLQCNSNSFSAVSGSSSCTDCDTKKREYQPEAGKSSCLSCSDSTILVNDDGDYECDSCSFLHHADSDDNECKIDALWLTLIIVGSLLIILLILGGAIGGFLWYKKTQQKNEWASSIDGSFTSSSSLLA